MTYEGDIKAFLAGLSNTLEKEQGAIVNGDQLSLEDLVRLINTIERKERALRASRRQAPRVSLQEHMARKSAAKAARESASKPPGYLGCASVQAWLRRCSLG